MAGDGSDAPAEVTGGEIAASVVDTPIDAELRDSVTEYALSVIVARALPDVRDGLKPVQRRILYAMRQARLTPDRGYRKSASAVGDVMRSYHPHGDASIYDALVRMAQPWAMRTPLVDGHGNFGSVDGDGAAAMRYTEARLAPAALPLLDGLDEDTVDFVENYDGTTSEPRVLPAGFPNLLVNGADGIAVGMSTRLPPHNLAEACRAARALLDHPDATVADLRAHLPGPDVPGGCTVVDDDLDGAYSTGRGSFRMRAVAHVDESTPRRKAVEVTALPFGVGPEAVMRAISDQIRNHQRLAGVADVKNLTDRHQGLRLRVELKSGANPAAVLAELYQRTPMEQRFHVNAVALVDGQPRTVGLVDLLAAYVDHRVDVVRRRTRHRLARAEHRAHVIDGLLAALDRINEVVDTIRSSRTSDTARTNLKRLLHITDEQATHILELPLRRLANLEVRKLRDERAELADRIDDLRDVLAREERLRGVVGDELDAVADAHADPRQSRITTADAADAGLADQPAEEPDEPCRVVLAADGTLGRHDRDWAPRKLRGDDVVAAAVDATTRGHVGAVAADGTLWWLPVDVVAEAGPRRRGRDAAATLADAGHPADGVRVVGLVAGGDPPAGGWLVATAGGVAKRLRGDALPRRDGQPVVGLRDGDEVVAVAAVPGDDAHVAFVTDDGRVLRTRADQFRPQGRTAAGVAAVRTGDDSSVVAAGVVDGGAVVVATDVGAAKVTPADAYPVKNRGGAGVRCVRLRSREQRVAAAALAAAPAAASRDGAAVPLDAAATDRRDGAAADLDAAVAVVGGARGR